MKLSQNRCYDSLIIKFLYCLCFIVLFSSNCFALSLDEYLSQIKEQNFGYQSSNISTSSSNLLSKKAFLLTSPNFFVDSKAGFENQNQAISFVRYKKLNTQNYSIGVEQNFSFGLNGKFYYNINRNDYQGLSSSLYPSTYYQTNPVLELDIPLWQGFLGSKIKANRDSIYYGKQADKFNFSDNSARFLVEAEKSYWQLVATKRIVLISKNALAESKKILQNSIKKANMNLGEESDILQARADVESRKLQLKQAENNARIAARNFNQKRYIDSDVVDEDLSKIDFTYLETLPIEVKMRSNRADIKAADASTKSAIALAKVEEESNKPKLDLYGGYGFNGLGFNKYDALSDSFSRNGDVGYVGIKFQMPLAIGLQSNIKKGAKASAKASKMNYRQKLFDQQNDWQNLVQNLQDYQENLVLNRKIENLQKAKFKNEQRLLKQGRSSTYQVLRFEQDYNQAQINTIQNAYQLLTLLAEKKLYELQANNS